MKNKILLKFRTSLPFGDSEIGVEVKLEFTPGYPARTSGGPDSWSPEEPPEIEVIKIKALTSDLNINPEELTEEQYRAICESAILEYEDSLYGIKNELAERRAAIDKELNS